MANTDESSLQTRLDSPFDYIVVGGGTAGLTVASRLSEDADIRVLVVEAGADRRDDPLILGPGNLVGLYGKDEYDWNFKSVPQPSLDGRQIAQPRGRVLGGTSALNYMMVVYPSRASIDNWANLGNMGWAYDDLEPYFRKFGTTNPPPQAAREAVGLEYLDDSLSENGPVQISFGEAYGAINSAWVKTFANLGLGMKMDPRSGKASGAFQNPASIDPKTKTRSYAATAYYSDAVRQRTNLVVLTDTLVVKVVTAHHAGPVVATSVLIRERDGVERSVSVKREVILAAGTFQSPQILELSGIGGRDLLERLQIPVLVDNPYVGEHLQDHPLLSQSFEVKDGIPSGDLFRDPAIRNALVEQYNKTKTGPMAQSSLTAAYLPLMNRSGRVSAEKRKQMLDSHLGPAVKNVHPAQEQEHALLRKLVESDDEPIIQYLLFPAGAVIGRAPKRMHENLYTRPENFISVLAVLNHPFSRGSCHITSSDIDVKPDWDPKFNSNPLDMEILAESLAHVEKVIATEPLKSLLKEGGARMPDFGPDDMEKAREIVRLRQTSCFHVSGSCAMLPEELGGVVNNRLMVYGTANIRVVDASVFPLEPLGNIQSTVYAVAEKAADLIKEDRKLSAK